jgi:microcystin-dependent protein
VSQPFLAEIKLMACNFPPYGYAFCAGQLMSISQNTALFSLIGTFYGGDGRTTFALPNLQSQVPIMVGQGPGLSDYSLGEAGGLPSVNLTTQELPAHTHTAVASAEQANLPVPGPDRLFANSMNGFIYQSQTTQNLTQLAQQAITTAGSGTPHTNMQPYLALNYCIALQGIYPKRP